MSNFRRLDPFSCIEDSKTFIEVSLAVMFFDIVGFTNTTTNWQMKACIRNIEAAIFDELNNNYYWNEKDLPNNLSNDFILVPTGDGYAIAFNPKYPSKDVLEIVKKLYYRLVKSLTFKIRVGVAKGQCLVHKDSNDKNNVFGYGINLSNRVMELALDNQILVHDELAKDINIIEKLNELHIINKVYKIKHGEEIKVYNFYGIHNDEKFGNENIPDDNQI